VCKIYIVNSDNSRVASHNMDKEVLFHLFYRVSGGSHQPVPVPRILIVRFLRFCLFSSMPTL
jgi:hypothetical protein